MQNPLSLSKPYNLWAVVFPLSSVALLAFLKIQFPSCLEWNSFPLHLPSVLGPALLFVKVNYWLYCIDEAGAPQWLSDLKKSTCNAVAAEDAGPIPGSGISPGEGHGNPLQYSHLQNLMGRGAWRAVVHGVNRVGHDWSDWAHSLGSREELRNSDLGNGAPSYEEAQCLKRSVDLGGNIYPI